MTKRFQEDSISGMYVLACRGRGENSSHFEQPSILLKRRSSTARASNNNECSFRARLPVFLEGGLVDPRLRASNEHRP